MMDRKTFDEIVEDFNRALPALIAGEPDRTDLMVPLWRAADPQEERLLEPGAVKAAVEKIYGVVRGELYAKGKYDGVAIEARHMCCYVMIVYAEMSQSATARSMRRDRSTVVSAAQGIEDRLGDPEMARRLQRVLRELGVYER